MARLACLDVLESNKLEGSFFEGCYTTRVPVRSARSCRALPRTSRRRKLAPQQFTLKSPRWLEPEPSFFAKLEYNPSFSQVLKHTGGASFSKASARPSQLLNSLTNGVPQRVPDLSQVRSQAPVVRLRTSRPQHPQLPSFMLAYVGRSKVLSEKALRLSKYPSKQS